MKKLNFEASVLVTAVTYFLTSLAGLILFFILYQNFDINVVGRYSIYQAILFFGSKIISLGTQYSLMKFVSHGDGEKVNINYLFSAMFIVTVTFIVAILLFSFDILNSFFQMIPYINVVIELSITILLYAINYLLKIFFNSYKDFIYYNLTFGLRTPLTIITIFLFYYEVLTEFYEIFLYVEIALFLINIFLIFRRRKKYIIQTFNLTLKSQLKYIKSSFLSSFFSEINFKVDVYCVAVLLGEYFAGIYALIAILGDGMLGIIYLIRNVITPSITEENVTNSRGEFINFVRKSLFPSALLTFGTSILASFVIYFGSQYIELLSVLKNSGFIPSLIILFGLSFLSFFIVFENILLQLNNPGLHTFGLIILTVSNISLNIVLIDYELIGITIATIVSFAIYCFYIFYYVNIRFKLNILKVFTTKNTS